MGVRAVVVSMLAVLWMMNLAEGAPRAVRNGFQRIRCLTEPLARALRAGVAHSPTFHRLVDEVEQSDLIVHIAETAVLPGRIAGALRFVAAAGGQRYIRIDVASWLNPVETVAIIGHELQHAVEIARNPEVVDMASMERLYTRIGEQRFTVPRSFDTAAARMCTLRIQHELLARLGRSDDKQW